MSFFSKKSLKNEKFSKKKAKKVVGIGNSNLLPPQGIKDGENSYIYRSDATNIPAEIFTYIIAGGVFYLIGVAFYLWKKLNYHHAVWHVFVLAGTVTHFFAVYNSIPINIKFL